MSVDSGVFQAHLTQEPTDIAPFDLDLSSSDDVRDIGNLQLFEKTFRFPEGSVETWVIALEDGDPLPMLTALHQCEMGAHTDSLDKNGPFQNNEPLGQISHLSTVAPFLLLDHSLAALDDAILDQGLNQKFLSKNLQSAVSETSDALGLTVPVGVSNQDVSLDKSLNLGVKRSNLIAVMPPPDYICEGDTPNDLAELPISAPIHMAAPKSISSPVNEVSDNHTVFDFTQWDDGSLNSPLDAEAVLQLQRQQQAQVAPRFSLDGEPLSDGRGAFQYDAESGDYHRLLINDDGSSTLEVVGQGVDDNDFPFSFRELQTEYLDENGERIPGVFQTFSETIFDDSGSLASIEADAIIVDLVGDVSTYSVSIGFTSEGDPKALDGLTSSSKSKIVNGQLEYKNTATLTEVDDGSGSTALSEASAKMKEDPDFAGKTDDLREFTPQNYVNYYVMSKINSAESAEFLKQFFAGDSKRDSNSE